MTTELEEELKERLHTRRLDRLAASFSSASISSGRCYSLDDDSRVFVKTNGSLNARVMFDGELESLKQINATKTIRAPKGINVIHNYDGKQSSAMVMEYLDISSLDAQTARLLGRDLARLHDYNNKVIRFHSKASKWVGNKIPSTKRTLEIKAESAKRDKSNDDDYDDARRADKDTDDDQEEENQFSKHSLRVGPNNLAMSRQAHDGRIESEDNDELYSQRFVPEPGTDQVTEFGFHVDTSCGHIPQVNEWTRDWVSFYARHRLDYMIRMILSDHSDRELNEQWSHLQNKVDKFFSDFEHRGSGENEIVPALLHGDLWSGNVAQLAVEGEQPQSKQSVGVVYDPASFYGHSEYEFGIVRMFGGIPKEFEQGYFDELPKGKLFERRNKLYQLFHHLNHWNHFGSGYRPSSLAIMKSLNSSI